MNKKQILALIFCFIGLFAFSIGFASEQIDSNSFKSVQKEAITLGKKYLNSNVLLVFDIDNTLLSTNQWLGSATWWYWQSDLNKHHPNSKFLVTRSYDHLLRIQEIFFALENMHPTEITVPIIIKRLQRKGFKTIVLTARDPNYRNSTERSLLNNCLNFRASSLSPHKGYPGKYLPYQINNLPAYGINLKNIIKHKLIKPRYVSYMNGIFMASGLNKGAMLLSLLKKTGADVKAIIFVDDQKENTDNIYQAFKNSPIDIDTIRYGHEDYKAKLFNKKAKLKATKDWHQFRKIANKVFHNNL